MTKSSWMAGERTIRTYKMLDGELWNVDNQFQEVDCPHCKEKIYCRLTRILRAKPDSPYDREELRTTYRTNLPELKKLQVTWLDEPKEHAVVEKEHNGKWVLACDGRELGIAIE